MQVGIVGLPQTGKSTLFDLLTGGTVRRTPGSRSTTGVALVPDARLAVLRDMFNPRKFSPAQITFVDIPGFTPGEQDRTRVNEFFAAVNNADAFVHVLRAFATGEAYPALGDVNPVRDFEALETEFMLADLQLVETRLERLEHDAKKGAKVGPDLPVLRRFRETLEAGRPLRTVSLTPEEAKAVAAYRFLSDKPAVMAVNTSEQAVLSGEYPHRPELEAYASARSIPVVTFCGTVEAEIASLPPEDRSAFMAEYHITEPGIARVARAAYASVGLIQFFTVGEDEVKAWPIREGSDALTAAGKIHTDIARGFIWAEVVSYADLVAAGSMKACREQGLLRLEGKDYIVRDGDIVHFRFAV